MSIMDKRVFNTKAMPKHRPLTGKPVMSASLRRRSAQADTSQSEIGHPGGRRRRMTNHVQTVQLLPFGIRVNNRFASVFVDRVYRLF